MSEDKYVAFKRDEGKCRIDLIPPEAIFAMGSVLTHGDLKYNKGFVNKWDELCYAKGVVRVSFTTQKASAGLVMKDTYGSWSLILQKDNGKTEEIGVNETLTELSFWQSVDRAILEIEEETLELGSYGTYENLDLQNLPTNSCVRKAVKSVEQQNFCTLITVIQQGSLEESYAVSATTALECLEIMWRVLEEHLHISKPLNKVGSNRNWEHGMSWGRVFGAMMRHAWAWWAGKEPTSENFAFGGLDNESKMSHSWHFLACAAMLVAYEDRKMHSYDDRPNIKEMTKE